MDLWCSSSIASTLWLLSTQIWLRWRIYGALVQFGYRVRRGKPPKYCAYLQINQPWYCFNTSNETKRHKYNNRYEIYNTITTTGSGCGQSLYSILGCSYSLLDYLPELMLHQPWQTHGWKLLHEDPYMLNTYNYERMHRGPPGSSCIMNRLSCW